MPFGPMELLIILGICLLLFGASKLPEIGSGLGRGMREFKENLTGGPKEDEKLPEQAKLPN